jgi:CRP-like cAMP-binding protein
MKLIVRPQLGLQNRLISALPPDTSDCLRPNLIPVMLSLGEIIYDRGESPEHMYFPAGAVISLLYITEDGASVEIGMVGNDGVVGVALLMGRDTMPYRAIVQVAGVAFKLRAKLLQHEFARSSLVQQVLLCYIHELLAQISQTAVCNRLHAVEKRLCRWLLLSHDRAQSNHLAMTQEFISNMLGARRESVTVAAARLQDSGLIDYSRGHITIRNRTGLESAACECYQAVKDEIDQLPPAKPSHGMAEECKSRVSNFRS